MKSAAFSPIEKPVKSMGGLIEGESRKLRSMSSVLEAGMLLLIV